MATDKTTGHKVFNTGAQRGEEDPARYEFLGPWGLEKVAKVLTHGAKKYKPRNYLKGIPTSNYVKHIERHLQRFKMMGITGDKNMEDICQECDPDPMIAEMAHLACNALMCLDTLELIRQGKLDEKLNDIGKEEK